MGTADLSTGILPARDFLKMGVSMLGVVAMRAPEPLYRVVFRINLLNGSPTSVRLTGRKWTLKDSSGCTRFIEASQVFNDTPVLTPGAVYSYSGYQEFSKPPTAMEVRFFGVDQRNRPFISPPLVFPRRGLATGA